MAKFSGLIGYALLAETAPGVWVDTIVEKKYRGDLIRNQRRIQNSDQVNDDIDIDNSISIVADEYAYANLGNMKYIVLWNIPWKIKSIQIDRPRMTIWIGGVYNGERPPRTP